MSVKRTDTGGEFSGPLPLVILLAAEGPGAVAEASPPAADAHEQIANSEFATSVRTPAGRPRSVRQPWTADGKADNLIAGRENGQALTWHTLV